MLLAGCLGSEDSTNDNSNSGASNEAGDSGSDPVDESTPTPRPDRDGDGIPDAEDDFPDDPSYSVLLDETSDTRQIPEDEWYQWNFELNEQAVLSYDFVVRSGPAIDAILTDDTEYDQLQEGNRFRYYSEGSVMDDEGGQVTTTLAPGTYHLVLDNSDAGEAQPPTNFDDDIAEVEIEIQILQ
ncbi:hypothetical protein [Halobaculum roseum]|uniref:Uncharacterized protein n=1 Tax=Halobaculum roseum TaxID=2175149 RepID=A0ABD5MGE8_9EURY|nr:hypothetical protein [Halobaculum roseum]QZY02593.1 hypothetical protein K6T36_15095 [Halobaculum roseum]